MSFTDDEENARHEARARAEEREDGAHTLACDLAAVLDRFEASGIVLWRDSRVARGARKVRLAIIADPAKAPPTIEAESLAAALLKLAEL